MTNQELFDACIGHVLKQGKPAIKNSSCVYLTESGLSCAVGGPIVAAGLYDPAIEQMSIDRLLDPPSAFKAEQQKTLHRIVIALGVSVDQFPFLAALQKCHDRAACEKDTNAEFIRQVKGQAKIVASDFNLNTQILE